DVRLLPRLHHHLHLSRLQLQPPQVPRPRPLDRLRCPRPRRVVRPRRLPRIPDLSELASAGAELVAIDLVDGDRARYRGKHHHHGEASMRAGASTLSSLRASPGTELPASPLGADSSIDLPSGVTSSNLRTPTS